MSSKTAPPRETEARPGVTTREVRVLEGHGHIATFTGPTLLAELVTAFLHG